MGINVIFSVLLLAASSLAAAEPFRVAIDIGHTPKVAGAGSASGLMEYQFNKRMATVIAGELRRDDGLAVTLINPSGTEIGLWQRGRVANEARADLFLSVHHDSAQPKYVQKVKVNGRTGYQSNHFSGFSVFFSQKNVDAAGSLRFAKALGAAMKAQGLSATPHHAEKIPGEGRDLLFPETGVYRYDDLIVLKAAKMPAVLLECGVIVNPAEEAELLTRERQQKTADAVRAAVLQMKSQRTEAMP